MKLNTGQSRSDIGAGKGGWLGSLKQAYSLVITPLFRGIELGPKNLTGLKEAPGVHREDMAGSRQAPTDAHLGCIYPRWRTLSFHTENTMRLDRCGVAATEISERQRKMFFAA